MSNTGWILLTFIHVMKNEQKLVKFCPKLWWKFTVFSESILGPSLFVLTKLHIVLVHKWTKCFTSHEYHSYLTKQVSFESIILHKEFNII